jgi:hypothetical protein
MACFHGNDTEMMILYANMVHFSEAGSSNCNHQTVSFFCAACDSCPYTGAPGTCEPQGNVDELLTIAGYDDERQHQFMGVEYYG